MLKKKLLVLFAVCCIMADGLLIIPCSARDFRSAGMVSQTYPVYLPEETKVLPFSSEYAEMRLGLAPGELLAITVTSMSKNSEMLLDGVQVQLYDTILAGQLDRLTYRTVQGETGWFSFVPVCRDPRKKICAAFNIVPAQEKGLPSQEVVCMTRPDTQVAAALPYHADIAYITVRKPLKGRTVCFAGRCVYIPDAGAEGQDSFVLTALRKDGRVSQPIRVTAAIKK